MIVDSQWLQHVLYYFIKRITTKLELNSKYNFLVMQLKLQIFYLKTWLQDQPPRIQEYYSSRALFLTCP